MKRTFFTVKRAHSETVDNSRIPMAYFNNPTAIKRGKEQSNCLLKLIWVLLYFAIDSFEIYFSIS